MSTTQELKIFDDKHIRTFWDDKDEKWLFCINDIVAALTDSPDPADYFKTRRKRDKDLDDFVRGSKCPTHSFVSTDGKPHAVRCMDLQGIFRIIQSIPSKKAGLTAREYKRFKGLKQENLRDNMTNEELVMNMLAELTTSNITKEEHPETMSEHASVAKRGGSVAKVAREAFEKQTGKKVVSSMSMKRFIDSQQPQLDLGEDEKEI